ncbi:MAG: hypothetical protein QOJ19_2750 [Acidimicrobiia bacterium]|nr:hypothetical protein [Acidimicrobiia bacterium]
MQGLAVLLITAIVAVVVLTWWNRRGSAAAAWDPRVAALVPVVEKLRGLRFEQPVRVDLLSATQWAQRVGSVAGSRSGAQAVLRTAEALHALGAGGPDADQDAWQAMLSQSGRGAWYDPGRQRVSLLGRDPSSPLVRDRIVQELTHAVQHQALGASLERGQSMLQPVLGALLDGDAIRVARADAASAGRSAPATPANDSQGLGRSMVDAIVAWRGQEGLDAALRKPPSSPAALLDPVGSSGENNGPDLRHPAASAGEEVVARGTLGPVRWLDILTPNAGMPSALRAAAGWVGDAYLLVRKGGKTCVKVTVAAPDSDRATAWGSALQQWRTSEPQADRTVESDATSFRVISCVSPEPRGSGSATAPSASSAPGSSAPGSSPAAASAPIWAAIWVNQLVAAAGSEQPRPSPELARCAAIEATSRLSLEQLADWEAPRTELLDGVAAARPGCQANVPARGEAVGAGAIVGAGGGGR